MGEIDTDGLGAELMTIPARSGAHALVAAGRRVRVVNTHGSQVVDTWAFDAADPTEFMSLEHCRVQTSRAIPAVGDVLCTNRRAPILTILEDSSGCVHDTLCAACDIYRYHTLGHEGWHANCTENLHAELRALGFETPERPLPTPAPLNLFQNVPLRPDGAMFIEAPVSIKGGAITFRAERDLAMVFSACPMDLTDTNGAERTPRDAHFQILG